MDNEENEMRKNTNNKRKKFLARCRDVEFDLRNDVDAFDEALQLTDEEDTEEKVSVDAVLKTPPKLNPEDVINPEPIETPFELAENKPKRLSDPKVLDEIINELPCESGVYNTRALSKHAKTYELEKFEKNALVIFNQENIYGYSPRKGTEKDVESLTVTFQKFGFEVIEHKDLTKDEVLSEIKEFSSRDLRDYGCIAVAVLTHGSSDGMLRAKDMPYSETEIISQFKVHDKPYLVSKPKFLIVQETVLKSHNKEHRFTVRLRVVCIVYTAFKKPISTVVDAVACRGKEEMQGIAVLRAGKLRKDLDEDSEPYVLPTESDMLILHSSYVGKPSHRHEVHGSWFIQSLCSKINELAETHDLESIITEVKREVAIDKYHKEFNRRTSEYDINKQMPVMTSTLIRKLYLRRYMDPPIHKRLVKMTSNVMESTNDVLDETSSDANMGQYSQCLCYLDQFAYLKSCLEHYLEDCSDDETAKNYLGVANTFQDLTEFNSSKEQMVKAISKHLMNKAEGMHFYKYLYFYKD